MVDKGLRVLILPDACDKIFCVSAKVSRTCLNNVLADIFDGDAILNRNSLFEIGTSGEKT